MLLFCAKKKKILSKHIFPLKNERLLHYNKRFLKFIFDQKKVPITTKLEGGGALVNGPLKKELFC